MDRLKLEEQNNYLMYNFVRYFLKMDVCIDCCVFLNKYMSVLTCVCMHVHVRVHVQMHWCLLNWQNMTLHKGLLPCAMYKERYGYVT